MSIRKELVLAGEWPGEAQAVGGSTELGITLTTSNSSQALAYPITKANSVIGTTGVSGNSIVLPVADQGDWLLVSNWGAAAVSVYPPSGWAFHGGTLNAVWGKTIAAGSSASFTVVTDPNKALPQGGYSINQYAGFLGG